tara:strand:- start:643 stop:816 length:174 start_codon:yes stop_codon:yes gene_type:complete
MKKYLLIFFLLTSCSIKSTEVKNNVQNIIFSENLTLEEFKIKLEEYSKFSPYPNIDN